MILSCLVACIIYIDSDKFYDSCRINVKRVYASENYYYVTPVDDKYTHPAANVTIQFKGQVQSISKYDCKGVPK